MVKGKYHSNLILTMLSYVLIHIHIKYEGIGSNLKAKQVLVHVYTAPAYGVYISQLIQYSRACDSYQDFLDRGLLLTRKLLNQWFLLVKMKWSLRKFYDRHHDLVDHYGVLCHKWPRICSTCRKHSHSLLITGFVTRLTQQVSLVEQELLTLPEHPSLPRFLVGFVLVNL